uniref:Zinc finger protein-like 1 n=1 Tax=Phasianus colchicus TaxID=9054 RepID=A0A669QQ70_PHACC
MGPYGSLWGSIGPYVSPCVSMGRCAARVAIPLPPAKRRCLADVVHWRCLCIRCRSLPPLTAPAGFRCPTCAAPLFPPPDTRGPVADALRSRLAAVSWARPGLGLPLLEDAEPEPEETDSSEWGGGSGERPQKPKNPKGPQRDPKNPKGPQRDPKKPNRPQKP